jgi:hypothetical protein
VYFWRIDRLKSELAVHDLAPQGVCAYATAHVVLWSLATLAPTEEAPLSTREEVALILSSLVIIVLGLWAAFRANGADVGRDLAGRLLALSWVIGVRLMAVLLGCFAAIFIAAVLLALVTEREIPDIAIKSFAWAFAVGTNIVFFWRLAHHLRDLNRRADGGAA